MSSLEIAIVGSHTAEPHSMLSSSFTVRPTQEYEVQVNLPTQTHVVSRRYKQFKKLHLSVCPTQLVRVAKSPLAEFPKKTIYNKYETVIEQRTAMLESYLRVAAMDPALLPIVLEFLGVPQQIIEAIAHLPSESTDAKISEGEMLILTLQNRLARDPANRIGALDHFLAKFFQQHRHVKREIATALMADLVPLCGDSLIGSLALEAVYKTISSTMSRTAGEFKAALLRTPLTALAAMNLDGHILRKFQGDSNAQAFAVLSILSDYYAQSGGHRNLQLVLNGNSEALQTFTNWQQGTLISSQQATVSDEWIMTDCSDCPYLTISHRAIDGDLEVHIALYPVNASPQRIVECITNPSLRRKWHPYIVSGKTVEELSQTESLVEFYFDNRGMLFSQLTLCRTETLSSGDVEITYHRMDEQRNPGPVIVTYLIDSVAEDSSTRRDSEASNDSFELPTLQHEDSQVWETRVTYRGRYSGELKKMRYEDFANGRERLKGSWKAFKNYAETQHASRMRKSQTATPLHLACTSKILSPRFERRSLPHPK